MKEEDHRRINQEFWDRINPPSKFKAFLFSYKGLLAALLALFAITYLGTGIHKKNTQFVIVNNSSEVIFCIAKDFDISSSPKHLHSIKPGQRLTLQRSFHWDVPATVRFYTKPSKKIELFVAKASNSAWQKQQRNDGAVSYVNEVVSRGAWWQNEFILYDFVTGSERRSADSPTIADAFKNSSLKLASIVPFKVDLKLTNSNLHKNWMILNPGSTGSIKLDHLNSNKPSSKVQIQFDVKDQELLQELLTDGKKAKKSELVEAGFSHLHEFELLGDKAFFNARLSKITEEGAVYSLLVELPNDVFVIKGNDLPAKLVQVRIESRNIRSRSHLHLINLTPFHLNLFATARINQRETQVEFISLAPGDYRKITRNFIVEHSNFQTLAFSTNADSKLASVYANMANVNLVFGKNISASSPNSNKEDIISELAELGESLKTDNQKSILIDTKEFAQFILPFGKIERNDSGSYTCILSCDQGGELQKTLDQLSADIPQHILKEVRGTAVNYRRALDLRAKYRHSWARYHMLPVYFPGTLQREDNPNAAGVLVEDIHLTACGVDNQFKVGDRLLEIEGQPIFGVEEVAYLINQGAFLRGVRHPLSFTVYRDGKYVKGQMLWAYNEAYWRHYQPFVSKHAARYFGSLSGLTLDTADEILCFLEKNVRTAEIANRRYFWNLHFVEANRQIFPIDMHRAQALTSILAPTHYLTKKIIPKKWRHYLDTIPSQILFNLAEHGVWIKLTKSPMETTSVMEDLSQDAVPLAGATVIMGYSFKGLQKLKR